VAWFFGQPILVLVLGFLLGLAAGWWLWGSARAKAPAVPSSTPERGVAAAPAADVKPAVDRTEPTDGAAPSTITAALSEPVSAEPIPATVAVAQPAPSELPQQRAAETTTAVADDLKRIEGIGPKMAAALGAAGITTYAGLAAADETTIKAAISAAGMRFSPSLPTWPRQAQLLADGDVAGFAAMTRRLKPR
jgi:predicted flap endonuclease-1-like 5' DNA nuclease